MRAATLEGCSHSVATDLILKLLGLEICADTLVGDAYVRGISGGQKKRVSLGKLAKLDLCCVDRCRLWDQVGTGLCLCIVRGISRR